LLDIEQKLIFVHFVEVSVRICVGHQNIHFSLNDDVEGVAPVSVVHYVVACVVEFELQPLCDEFKIFFPQIVELSLKKIDFLEDRHDKFKNILISPVLGLLFEGFD
jgi:hypothetical protein